MALTIQANCILEQRSCQDGGAFQSNLFTTVKPLACFPLNLTLTIFILTYSVTFISLVAKMKSCTYAFPQDCPS
jgi:hypothetical protein